MLVLPMAASGFDNIPVVVLKLLYDFAYLHQDYCNILASDNKSLGWTLGAYLWSDHDKFNIQQWLTDFIRLYGA